MTVGIKANGVDLATIFGAKGPTTAAATGIKSSGTDLSQLLLALSDGVAVAATGIKAHGVDLNTIFGAPSGTLPINGGTYTTTLTRSGASGARASVKFVISGGSSWALASSGLAGTADPGTNFASGSLPAGSVNVMFTVANATGTAQVLGTTGSQIAVSTNPTLESYVASAGTIGTANGSNQVTVTFYNSGGTAISTTTYTASMVIQN